MQANEPENPDREQWSVVAKTRRSRRQDLKQENGDHSIARASELVRLVVERLLLTKHSLRQQPAKEELTEMQTSRKLPVEIRESDSANRVHRRVAPTNQDLQPNL